MKKRIVCRLIAPIIICAAVFVSGCGDKSSDMKDALSDKLEEATVPSEEAEEAGEDEKAEEAGSGEETAKTEPSKSKPASLYFLTKDKYVDDVVEEYAVNLLKSGYTGDIGDVIRAYKDVDLDGDGDADIIERYGDDNDGYGYRISFTGGGDIETGAFSCSPNEGEVIEFADLDGDCTDEILIAHCTSSTAGPLYWQTFLYAKNDKGEWKGFPLIHEDNKLYCSDLQNMIEERTGVPYKDRQIRFAGVELTDDGVAMLADFGMKDGPDQTLDFEGVILEPDLSKIKKGEASDDDAFIFKGSSRENAGKYWPLDAAEEGSSFGAGEDDLGSDGSEEETIPEYFVYVKASDGYANLRTGPGTEYDIICQVPNDESLEVYRGNATDSKGKTWLKVAYWHSSGEKMPDGTDDPGSWTTGWIAESQLD